MAIAALNEEHNVRSCVQGLKAILERHGAPFEILVFNDHSADRTGEVADAMAKEDRRIRAFHNLKRLNIGGILKAGLKHACYGYYFLLGGDDELDLAGIEEAIPLLDRAPMVLGYIANPEVRPRLRQLLSKTYVRVVNALFGTSFRYTNGPAIIPTELMRSVEIRTTGFAYMTEPLVKLVLSGVDYAEIGMRMRRRQFGASTAMRPKNWVLVAQALATIWWDVRVAGRSRYRRPGRCLVRR